MGLLCLTSSDELLNTVLGRRVCLGLGYILAGEANNSVFWILINTMERQKIRDWCHIVFLIFWIYLSTVFILIYSGKNTPFF